MGYRDELSELTRGPLLKMAKERGVESIRSKSNSELIDDLVDIKHGIEEISAGAITAALTAALGKEFERHRVTGRDGSEPGDAVDLYWHEDLDEVQAYRVSDLKEHGRKAEPIATVALVGSRGRIRKRLIARLGDAVESVGLEVNHRGITW